MRLQKSVANLIRLRALVRSMLTAIRLNDELRSERHEVDDVGTDGRLSTKMKA